MESQRVRHHWAAFTFFGTQILYLPLELRASILTVHYKKLLPGGPVRLCATNAGGLGLIPGQGTRSHMLQLRVREPQLKILHVATIRDPTCHSKVLAQPKKIITLKKIRIPRAFVRHPTVGGCHLAFSMLITLWGLALKELVQKCKYSGCCCCCGWEIACHLWPRSVVSSASLSETGRLLCEPTSWVKSQAPFGYIEPLTEVSKVRSANIHTDIYRRINSQ